MVRTYALAAGAGYGEYLLREAVAEMYWEGRVAEMLEVEKQAVTAGGFKLLEWGSHPVTGEVLRDRTGYRYSAESHRHARGVYDVVVHAPKSVSVMGLLYDQALWTAHKEAVEYVKCVMEELAQVRRQVGGEKGYAFTGNALWGSAHHYLSRALDPQIHTHLPVLNLTFDAASGTWKALNAMAIYKARENLSELYRMVLAEKVSALGYEITERNEGSVQCKKWERRTVRDRGWEIAGVSPEIMQKFSQRSQDRDRSIAHFREVEGREPNAYEVERAVQINRKEKQVISISAARELQLGSLYTYSTELEKLHEQAVAQRKVIEINVPRDQYRWVETEQIKAPDRGVKLLEGDVLKPTKEEVDTAKRRVLNLEDHVAYEPELFIREWNYAGERLGIGYRSRRQKVSA